MVHRCVVRIDCNIFKHIYIMVVPATLVYLCLLQLFYALPGVKKRSGGEPKTLISAVSKHKAKFLTDEQRTLVDVLNGVIALSKDKPRVQQTFDALLDGSGYDASLGIDQQMFKDLVRSSLKLEHTELELDDLFCQVDTDGGGTISIEEYQVFMEQQVCVSSIAVSYHTMTTV